MTARHQERGSTSPLSWCLLTHEFARELEVAWLSRLQTLGAMWLVLFLSAYIAIGIPQAAAQSAITVTPFLIEISGTPGTTHPFSISVVNQAADQDAPIIASVVPLVQTEDGRYVIDQKGIDGFSAVSWISLRAAQFTVGGGTSHGLTGTVTIPRGHQGGAYAGVMVELGREDKQETGTNLSLRLRTRFLVVLEITATGRLTRSLHVPELHVDGASGEGMAELVRRFGPGVLRISAVVANEGNVHVLASGTVTVRDSMGRKVKEFPLGQGRGLVLPKSRVEFTSILPAGLPSGEYTMQAVMRYGGARPAILKKTFTIGAGSVEGGDARGLRLLVDPERLDLTIRPGALRTSVLTVQNMEPESVVVKAALAPLAFTPDGEADPEATPGKYSAVTWGEVRPAEVRLRPGDRRNIQVVMRAPRDFAGGGYAQVVLSARLENETPGQDASTDEATQLFITSEQGREVSVEILNLVAQVAPDNSEAVLTLVVANTGNVHTSMAAQAVLSSIVLPEGSAGVEYIGQGEKVRIATGAFPALPGPVLPEEARVWQLRITGPLSPGDYVADVSVRTGPSAALTKSVEFFVPILDDQADQADQSILDTRALASP